MPVEILADSVNVNSDDRLTTFLLTRFPKFLQAELRTHRSTSQSHYSSRAIPIEKVIQQVLEDPFIPAWTRYQKGMGGVGDLTQEEKETATRRSLELRDIAVMKVRSLIGIGIAKQDANRYLEPWMHGAVILTADAKAWDLFFSLRCADRVQPDMKTITEEMRLRYFTNNPTLKQKGDWHIPWREEGLGLEEQLKISAARCARTSYNRHDSKDFQKDFELAGRLIRDRHMTPFEHQARAMPPGEYKNFHGWQHCRQMIEEGRIFSVTQMASTN